MLTEAKLDEMEQYSVGDISQHVIDPLIAEVRRLRAPVPIRLNCPSCGTLHIDEGEFATKPHHTHSCQGCGMTWRPAVAATVGVQFLPGFKNAS